MRLNRKLIFVWWVALGMPLVCGRTLYAQQPTVSDSVPWNLSELKKVPTAVPADEAVVEGVQAIYYQGLPFRGKPTKVFAYVGFPPEANSKKVPGIILVHGGGGSAFASWVKLWNSRGYAAIAMDLCGTIPIGKTAQWQSHADAGPAMQNTDEVTRPIEEQWMLHAVADVLLAHSLLASYSQVDANRIGITGISWGGVITSTVAGLDDRLKFAAPVYGCGFITSEFGDGTRFVGRTTAEELVQQWRKLWDPCAYLPKAKIPMLWVTGTNDFAFTLRALQMSYQSTPAPHTLCIRLRMPHGHGGPGESPEEIAAFADSVVNQKEPLLQVVRQGTDADKAWVDYESATPVQSAELLYTTQTGKWQDRLWNTIPATVEPSFKRVSAVIPAQTTAYFFNLIDRRKLIVSSELTRIETAPNSP